MNGTMSVAVELLKNQVARKGRGRLWGYFETVEAANAYLRRGTGITYDDDRVVQINLDVFKQVHSFDWQVLFFLQKMIHAGTLKVLTDFGGHVGVKFHAYREFLTFPKDFQWQVVDVPAACLEGRRHLGDDTLALSFHERIEETAACDVLFCSGVLQYCGLPLAEIVRRLPRPPTTIILNKVATARGASFYTTESFGLGRMPYFVMDGAILDEIRQDLGYDRVTGWSIPGRESKVLFPKGVVEVEQVGEVWARRDA